MRISSHIEFSRYKEVINAKLSDFIARFQNAPVQKRNLLHYQSVINVSKEIIRFNNKEANKLKDLLIEYFETIDTIDFSVADRNTSDYLEQKKVSLDRYFQYISPVGDYLIQKSGFGPNPPDLFYFILGVILDSLIYFFLSKDIIPLPTLVVIIVGLIAREKRRKAGKVIKAFQKKLRTTTYNANGCAGHLLNRFPYKKS